MSTKVTKEEIDAFMAGSDPEEHILKIECEKNESMVRIYKRNDKGKKVLKKVPFYPFCWATRQACRDMFNGNKEVFKYKMAEFGLKVSGLETKNEQGVEPERMANGYRVLIQAIKPMSFNDFSNFFKQGKCPLRPKNYDKNFGRDDYIFVSPVEMFMIYSGKRQFKGYDNYDDLLRFIFDLETTGLDPHINSIDQIGMRTNKGYEKIIKIEGNETDKNDNELKGIGEFFAAIDEIEPDIITGHNIENFDFNFIDTRLSILLHTDMKGYTAAHCKTEIFKRNYQNVLKLGGEVEYYFQTVRCAVHITDSLFAVRRSQAQDSNMLKADLKYVTKYSKLNKENRVYIPGKIIGTTWADNTPTYAFNNSNGDWYKITDDKPLQEGYEIVTGTYIGERYLLDDLYEADKVELKFNQTNFFLSKLLPVAYDKVYTMGTAGIWKYIMLAWSYEHGLAIPSLITRHTFTGGLSRLMKVGFHGYNKHEAERIATATDSGIEIELTITDHDGRQPAKKIVLKLDYNSLYPSILLSFWLQTDVDITGAMLYLLEYVLTQREFFKGLKKKFGKLRDAETRKIYGIKKLAEEGKFDGIEEEYEKLQQKIIAFQEKWYKDGSPESKEELDAAELLMNGLPKGSKKRKEALRKEKEYDAQHILNDCNQLMMKVIGNSFFGSFGSGRVFPWSDIVVAENVTCIGRMMFRLLCYHFKETIPNMAVKMGIATEENKDDFAYEPIVGDTDGVNMAGPKFFRYDENHPYISTGLGRNVEKGKAYVGARADVAEFEDLYMHDATPEGINKLGLDIDDIIPANILLKRKHYLDLLDDGKVKTVGGAIKSRSIPIYIQNFFKEAFPLLLHGEGKKFLDLYYDTVEKIYNYKIPLSEIASIGKIKTSLETYRDEYCKQVTAAGSKKSRQAWYELALLNHLDVHMGDAIYYINTGDKANDSDVQRLTKYYVGNIDMTKEFNREFEKIKRLAKKGEQEYIAIKDKCKNLAGYIKEYHKDAEERDELIFNCVMLENNIVEDEEPHYCSEEFKYNVDKYITQFNNRVKTLLVVFKPEIRYWYNEKGKRMSNILITNPKERKYFTDEECAFCIGCPENPSDQDKYEDVMRPEDKEIRFWLSVGKKPPFCDECGLDWNALVDEYYQHQELLKQEGIREEVEEYNKTLESMTQGDVNEYITEGTVPNEIMRICDVNLDTGQFISKKYNVAIGNIFDIIDKVFGEEE